MQPQNQPMFVGVCVGNFIGMVGLTIINASEVDRGEQLIPNLHLWICTVRTSEELTSSHRVHIIISKKENAKDNIMEITNFINTFIALDIVMVI